MNGIIIYKSKYGATKKYAEWLKEETGFKAVTISEADVNSLGSYDVIVLGGGVYASGIACVSFLRKIYPKIKDKKIIVFTCGASPYDEKFFNQVVQMNMKGDLTFMDRTLCKMLRKSLSKKDPKDYEVWEEALMSVGEDESGDWTDKSNLEPVIREIKKA